MNAYTQLPANTSNYTAFESMTTTQEYWQANQTCKMEKNSWWLLAIYYSVTELCMNAPLWQKNAEMKKAFALSTFQILVWFLTG